MKVLIIGCGSAGKSAAIGARRHDRSAEITIIGDEDLPEYSRCGLPFVLSKTVRRKEDLIMHPTDFYEKILGVDLKLETKALKIDVEETRILVENKERERLELSYDKLVYATGARPRLLDLPGSVLEGVYVLNSLSDLEEMRGWIEAGVSSAVVVGAGFLGLEIIEALRKLDVDVDVVEIEDSPLPVILDRDMGSRLIDVLEANGVKLHLNTGVRGFSGTERVEKVITGSGDLPAEMVVVAVGTVPNKELASEAGCEIGVTGGVKVNKMMETSVDNIYAAGDAAEYMDGVYGHPLRPGLAPDAVMMGDVAGRNTVGAAEEMSGIISNSTVKLWGLEVASVGYTLKTALARGVDAIHGRTVGSSRIKYFPDRTEVVAKLVVERDGGRIIGGQCIGEGAALRINTIALAITKQLSVEELVKLETNFAPPVTPEIDVFRIAGMSCLKRLTKH